MTENFRSAFPDQNTGPGPLPTELKTVLELPQFEHSAEEILKAGRALMAYSRSRTQDIIEQAPEDISFQSSLGALDDLFFEESRVLQRLYLLQNTHPEAAIREAARQIHIEYQNWAVEREYKRELYEVIKTYADKNEKLEAEDQRLLEETLKDYRKRGMELSEEMREKLMRWSQELSEWQTQFSTAINEHQAQLAVKEDELEGLDPDFIRTLPQNTEGLRLVSLDYPEYRPVMEFALREEVRRRLLLLKYETAAETNVELLDRILARRQEIAQLLGFASWSHLAVDSRMAKTPERVWSFLDEVEQRLRPKATEDLKHLKALKSQLPHQESEEVQIWDYSFLASRFQKEKFQVDSHALKSYFPLPQVLTGLFEIAGRLLSVDIEERQDDFPRWHHEVRLFELKDQKSKERLGAFYLDLHPREGKFSHAAAFSLIEGKYRPDGLYQRPVAAMVCNFPRGQGDQPALIPHEEVETLFHEFGHILHNLLTRAKFVRFSGTNVAWDFVEAPSQIMENWAWKPESLRLFARHYRDPQKILSAEEIQKMTAAKKAGAALFYLRQISLAKADLELHRQPFEGRAVRQINKVLSQVFLPIPDHSHFAAGWGHLMGYDSGYYGYAWADVMAADLFSRFEETGVFDAETGQRLRREIFEPGGGRDENLSLEAFLGRPLDSQAFFKELGAA